MSPAVTKSSGFFFDVDAWDGSKAVQRMSFAEEGVYFAMLRYLWSKRFLPDDPEAVAALIAINPHKHAEVVAAWPAVRRCFVASEHGPARIYNARLERTRRQQRENFKKRSAAGSIAGKASASKRKNRKEVTANESLTTVERSSTDKTREEETRSDLTRLDVIGVPRLAGKQRPIMRFNRFVVFQWQIDALIETLGEACTAIGLDEWFPELSRRADEQRLILDDSWAWIKAETTKEAQRLGFTIAKADAPPEGNKRVSGLIAGGERFLRGGV